LALRKKWPNFRKPLMSLNDHHRIKKHQLIICKAFMFDPELVSINPVVMKSMKQMSRSFLSIALFVCCLALHSAILAQVPGEGVFNIKNYGAKGNGLTLDTKAIAKAIAACVKAGGGTVFVPAGTFVTGTVQLFSNVNLHLSPGAILLASANTADYLLQTSYGFSGSGAGGKKLGLIFADKAENISITGTGTIDGRAAAFFYMDSVQVSNEEDGKFSRQGKAYMDPAAAKLGGPVMWKGAFDDRPGTQIVFHACKRAIIKDITIRNANDWTIDLNACDNVRVQGIFINNDMRIPNSDGIDMYDSRNIVISDCGVRAGDDAIAVVGTSNLTVTNCNLTSRSCGIRVGYNVFNDNNSGNLLFNNIRIYGANRGIGIFQRRKGDMENMIFSNMIIDTRLYPGQWWGHGEPIHISALPGLGFKEVGRISNLRISNIIAKGEEGIVIYGSDESRLQDIWMDNVQLTIVKGSLTERYSGNFDLRPANDSRLAIFQHDIPGVYARKIDGLTLKGLDIRWETGLPSWFTNAIVCDDFKGLRIEEAKGSAAPMASGEAMIALQDGSDAVLKDIGNTGKGKILSQQRVNGLVVDTVETAGLSVGGIPLFAASDRSAQAGKVDGLVKRSGQTFLLDGKPYNYIGTNYWQGGLLAVTKAGRQRVQRELTFLASQGITNLRILAGAEGAGAIDGSYRVGPSLQPEKGRFSENALRGLDYLLTEMRKRNMKAVLYLSNNWTWSGGFQQYLNWNGRLPDSQLLRKNTWDQTRDQTARFYSCSPCKEDYYNQVRKIVLRRNSITGTAYAEDSVIMAWELGNEPRPMRPSANEDYKQWIGQTAELIKSLDSRHLVTIGTEGQASTDDDIQLYKDIHATGNIDYLTIHVWPKNWGYFSDTAIAASMPAILRNTKAYVEKHAAVARSLNKPLVIEEFGLPRDLQNFAPSSPATLRRRYYETMFAMVKESGLRGGAIAGCNFWAFGGEGRPVKGQTRWKSGDGFLGDPPMEEQGLNAVFDNDASTWELIRSFTFMPPFR
jgi:mannan endo-1,4-beta-mannosidase